MENNPINLLDEINSISKIHYLKPDDIDEMMIQFAKRILASFRIERMSVWLFNADNSAIVSMGEYDLDTKEFSKNNSLYKKDFPTYIKAIQANNILLAPNVYYNANTNELNDIYFKKHNIISLMDIPLRIDNKLVGVMCFEKKGNIEREFSENEQTFALSISFVFASTLEARKRRAVQHLLEDSIKEKELLIQEINHRVKNNFAILIGLIRLSKEQGKTTDPKIIFEEYEQRVFSMLKIQDLLYQTKNYTTINISDYLKELVSEFQKSHNEVYNSFEIEIENLDYFIPSKSAIHFGLIITEIFLNAIKYALPNNPNFRFKINLIRKTNRKIELTISDNGKGFDFFKKISSNSLGLSLIKDLASDISLNATYPSVEKNEYLFVF
jgi:two-component sensor histidine kinase